MKNFHPAQKKGGGQSSRQKKREKIGWILHGKDKSNMREFRKEKIAKDGDFIKKLEGGESGRGGWRATKNDAGVRY